MVPSLTTYPNILFCSFLLPKRLLLPTHLLPHAANDAFHFPVHCKQDQEGAVTTTYKGQSAAVVETVLGSLCSHTLGALICTQCVYAEFAAYMPEQTPKPEQQLR